MRRPLRLLFVIVAILGPISACIDDPDDDTVKAGSGGSSGSSGKGAAGAGSGGSHDADAG
jgi:hypothetical protein